MLANLKSDYRQKDKGTNWLKNSFRWRWRKWCCHDSRGWRRDRYCWKGRYAGFPCGWFLHISVFPLMRAASLAWKTIIQKISSFILIRYSLRSYHLSDPSSLYDCILLCRYTNLQWTAYAWVCNNIHITTCIYACLWRRHRKTPCTLISSSLQNASKRKSAQFQNILHLGLEVFVLRICHFDHLSHSF